MKKRFSSLNLKDMAAWLLAIGTYAFLAAAGLAGSRLGNNNRRAATPRASRTESQSTSRPDSRPT